jgi:hypothetical protein
VRLGRFTLATCALAACASPVAPAGHVAPVGLPLVVSLPGSWSTQSFATGPIAFQAFSPNLVDDVEIQRQTPAPPATFFPLEFVAKIKQFVLANDPTASLDTSTVRLPAGRAVLVVAHARMALRGPAKELIVAFYGVEHGRAFYVFTLARPGAPDVAPPPLFARVMQSLRFTHQVAG